MKKGLSLLLALTLCLSAASAMAEASPILIPFSMDRVTFAFTMVPIAGTDYGYGVPEDWTALDVSEDEVAWGYIGRWQSPDQSMTMEVNLEDLTENVTMEVLAELMPNWAGYSQVTPGDMNGKAFIGYVQASEGIYGLLTQLDMGEGEVPLLLHLDFRLADTSMATMMTMAQIATLVSELVPEQ